MSHMTLVQETFKQGGWVRYHKTIAKELGIYAAIVLGNLVDKHSYWNKKGVEGFYVLRKDTEEETCLTAHQQRKGEEKLKEAGILTMYEAKHPSHIHKVNYYDIDYDVMTRLIVGVCENRQQTSIEDFNASLLKNSTQYKNKDNKNKLNKNKYIIYDDQYPSQGEGPDDVNIDNIGYEEELDHEEVVFSPSKTKVNNFVQEYITARSNYKLPAIKSYNKHIKNLSNIDERYLETFIENPELFIKFFEYCDDKSFGMPQRSYETSSDRSPSIIANYSVYERFKEYLNKIDTFPKKSAS